MYVQKSSSYKETRLDIEKSQAGQGQHRKRILQITKDIIACLHEVLDSVTRNKENKKQNSEQWRRHAQLRAANWIW